MQVIASEVGCPAARRRPIERQVEARADSRAKV